MQIVITDAATAALERLGAKVQDHRPILEAAGLAVVSLSTRSFNDPSVRAAPWAPLKPATIAQKLKEGTSSEILKRHGILFRSFRVIETTQNFVRVGSDRATPAGQSLAAIHQFGTKDGRIPPRPMMPIVGQDPGSARFTQLAVQRIKSAALEALKGLI